MYRATRYFTRNGKTAVIKNITKLNLEGEVLGEGETLWRLDGENCEFPEWDLYQEKTEDATTNTSTQSSIIKE